jgi:hypothetical protein
LGEGKRQLLQFAVLASNGQRAILFGPDLTPVWSIHPAILDKQIKAGKARLMSATSLFDAAAERALSQASST